MKILVADDSQAMRTTVTRALKGAGFEKHEVIEAANGQELLDLAASQTVGLIISDSNMPEVTGVGALKSLRARGDETPFVFCVPSADLASVKAATQGSAYAFLLQPCTSNAVREALAKILN